MVISGLGGNEAFCLRQKNLRPGQMVIGNSVQSLGFMSSIGAGMRNLAGGECPQVTKLVKDGRDAALARLQAEADQVGATGITGVMSELTSFEGYMDFLSTGSAVHSRDDSHHPFTSSFDGKELFCMMDAGYQPRRFAFGNIAYSVGMGGSLSGALKSMMRGEIPEFSAILNQTRHSALQRMLAEAKAAGANAVVGVEIDLLPFMGFHEMLMTGTAAYHPAINASSPVSCDLTCDELWSLTQMGYVPVKIVMGTAVYSLGLAGSITSFFKSFKRGEIPELTSMMYEAREHALDLLEQEAQAAGADEILGTDLYIHDFGGGIVEFLAVGTAVRKADGVTTESPVLPAQAAVAHRRTFRNSFDSMMSGDSQRE
ncbi:heavy metal-binding domain-containing protein [Paraburkholderia sp. UCT31]|nr:heavy metal-binding domain-containing protein [Paraburkholderia sp. UCT31]